MSELKGCFYLEYFDSQPSHDRCNDKCCVAQITAYGTRYYERSLLPKDEALQEIPNNQLHLGESGNYWDDTDNCDGSISYTKTSKLNEHKDKLIERVHNSDRFTMQMEQDLLEIINEVMSDE